MKTTAGSISTGDHLIIEINRGLKVKNEPPRQLKTVPLTAAGLAAAQASAAALSKANSRDSRAPKVASKSDSGATGVVTAARADEPARKGTSRGTTFTMAAIGVLAIACAGAAWTQRSSKTVVGPAPAAATAEAPQAATPAPAAQPAAAETALGFVVAPRAPVPAGSASAEAKAEVALPAAPATGMPAAAAAPAPVAEAAPEPAAPKRSGSRPRVTAEPVAKADPPAPAKPKTPEKTAAAAPEEKKPAPTPAAAPSSVDAILQQQLKSAIP